MIAKNHLEELAQKLLAVLPDNLQIINNDIQTKFHDVLKIAFTKLDLVTREEFDAQVKVLARTRAKVEALEEQLTKLIQP